MWNLTRHYVFVYSPADEKTYIPPGTRETSMTEFMDEEVERELKVINVNKSPGPDGIHLLLLRELVEEQSVPILDLFMKSMESGALPDEWKQAVIAPMVSVANASD